MSLLPVLSPNFGDMWLVRRRKFVVSLAERHGKINRDRFQSLYDDSEQAVNIEVCTSYNFHFIYIELAFGFSAKWF
jgi:hypothetical protein